MTLTKPAYLGIYINLERSPERRAAFDKQLKVSLNDVYGPILGR